MITGQKLYELAQSRYSEAKILLEKGKLEGAVYLCGYAVELMLKRKIVFLLDWDGYPNSKSEFKDKLSFKVHDLETLLHFSGLEKKIYGDSVMFARWQIARSWDSELRYMEIGNMTQDSASSVINASRDILNFILKMS